MTPTSTIINPNLPSHFLQEHLMISERKEVYAYTISVTVCVSGYFNELILSVVIFETKQSWGENNYQAEGCWNYITILDIKYMK
jgi:hypothetical protein